MQRDIIPYQPDAIIDPKATKIGYKISFLRFFHKESKPKGLNELINQILTLEKLSADSLEKVINI